MTQEVSWKTQLLLPHQVLQRWSKNLSVSLHFSDEVQQNDHDCHCDMHTINLGLEGSHLDSGHIS